MNDQLLRSSLQRIADEAVVIDLRSRVRARVRVIRRRRRAASAALSVAAVLVTALLITSPSEPDAAPPTDRPPPTAVLSGAPLGGVAGATLAVVDPGSGGIWVVAPGGRVARLPVPTPSQSGALPSLSADGAVLSLGSPGRATLVRTEDGSSSVVDLPGEDEHLVAVAPDARTAAYAADNQVDAIELTLVSLDGSDPSTVEVTASAAAGALVPVVWSDDGASVLVLEGAGATRVDLEPSPRPRRGVFVHDDLVLAHGWAAAPDLSRFAMGSASTSDGRRLWSVLDAESGRTVEEFRRPSDDRLIGWTAGYRLVWWHRTGSGYAVATTDLAGDASQTELRVRSTLTGLGATWTADEG
jgi:hypothetical protein